MHRTDRLLELIGILRDGQVHLAQDMAQRLGVSDRTIYRDMDALASSGVPVQGARGIGYRLTDAITLPPVTLTPDELEALNLGMAIVAEAVDPDLKAAATRLSEKIDAALPARTIAEADAWKFTLSSFSDAARGFAHMPTLRAAIKARQKLDITYTSAEGIVTRRILRPLLMEHWGRIWTLVAWCELRQDHRVFRVDLIDRAQALPELFADEPGKTLADYLP